MLLVSSSSGMDQAGWRMEAADYVLYGDELRIREYWLYYEWEEGHGEQGMKTWGG